MFANPLAATVKYNPHLWGADELRAIFVVRKRELDDLLKHIRQTEINNRPQHLLITGARGMGKSTLLRRLALAVDEDTELSKQWIALTFPEEQYTVSNLAELWRNVLDSLADTLERQGASTQELALLDKKIGQIGLLPASERETAALDCLTDWIKNHQRRLLLLIDSTDLLFAGLAEGDASSRDKNSANATVLWRLRNTLSHQPGILWLGASYQALEADHQYHAAFLDFFELMELRPLKVEEMREALLALARTFGAGRGLTGDAAVNEMTLNLDSKPERLKALRAMTGGNPRTTVMLYELFAAGGQDDIHSDLRRLLDSMTPLYKARMESLSEQACKLFAHIMEHWAPISARELGEISGIATTTVSGQLSRLETEGLIEKTTLSETKRSGFQASERLFNIWYLMRYAPRRLRQRLTWLVEFMRLWYSGDELSQMARLRAEQHRSGRLYKGEQLEYSRAMGLALSEADDARYQIEQAVFSAARISDQTRQALSELFELDGEDIEFTTAEDYLTRFQALDVSLVACPHVNDKTKDEWIKAVKSCLSLNLAEKERIALTAAQLKKPEYRSYLKIYQYERTQWESFCGVEAAQKIYEAVFKGDFFPDCPDSKLAHSQIMACFGEDAIAIRIALMLFEKNCHDQWLERIYKQAIKLNPDKAYLWNRLGVLFMRYLSRFDEAEAAFKQAIDLDPKNVHAWINLGYFFTNRLNRFDEAETAFKQAIELEPKHVRTWNRLGDLLADRLNRFDEAESAYRQAIELNDSVPYPRYNLARLLIRSGKTKEAEVLYRQAAAQAQGLISPDISNIKYVEISLQAHLWLNNQDSAMQALDRIAQVAASGNQYAFFKLKEQARECFIMGLGANLMNLQKQSVWSDFLQPFSLALAAATQKDSKAMQDAPLEIQNLAQEILQELLIQS